MSGYVSRIIQLDALTLDTELYSLIKNQLFQILNQFKVGDWTQRYGPEIQVFIKFLIWRFAVFRRGSTIGQSLLGVKYPSNCSGQLKLLFLIDAVIPYTYERLVSAFNTQPFFRKLEKPLGYAEGVIKIFEVVNFCIFLMQNRYPSLVHRILKLSMVPAKQGVPPSVGYTYQVRELLWHQFADFLMVILPLINIHRLRRYVKEWGLNPFRTKRQIISRSVKDLGDSVLICCACKQAAVIPQKRDSCLFCYYCLSANTLADSEYSCMDCPHFQKYY